MVVLHHGDMDTTTTARTDEATESRRQVRTDLRAGVAVLVVVVGGHLLWSASDAGVIAVLSRR